MWRKTLLLTVNFIIFINTEAALFSQLCNLRDSDCVTKTAQDFVPKFTAGIPDIGLEKSDPLFIKYINASSPALKLILRDTTITGLKDTIVKKIKFDESKKTIFVKLLGTAQLESQYEMLGNLLFLSIEGKGPLHAKLRKLEITINIDLKEKTGNDGKTHWIYEHNSHSFTLKDKSDVEFENLFSGNEVLATAAKEVIAQNGNEIVLEVGPSVLKAVVDAVLVRINELFDALPTDQLYIP